MPKNITNQFFENAIFGASQTSFQLFLLCLGLMWSHFGQDFHVFHPRPLASEEFLQMTVLFILKLVLLQKIYLFVYIFLTSIV